MEGMNSIFAPKDEPNRILAQNYVFNQNNMMA